MIDFDKEMRSTIWRGSYYGVNWKIVSNEMPRSEHYPQWYCSYLVLHRKQMSREDWGFLKANKREDRDGWEYGYLDDVIDMHGGITFYDYNIDRIEIGCDYNHYWDQDSYITIHTVYGDLQETIEGFLERFTIKAWCGNCGRITTEGKFIDPEAVYGFKCSKCLAKKGA